MTITKTTQTPAENHEWLRIRFSQIFDSRSERKTQNPSGVDSVTPDQWPPLMWSTTREVSNNTLTPRGSPSQIIRNITFNMLHSPHIWYCAMKSEAIVLSGRFFYAVQMPTCYSLIIQFICTILSYNIISFVFYEFS